MKDAVLLAQRASLGRTVCLVANEDLVNIIYRPAEQRFHLSPLASDIKNERIVLAGTTPYRVKSAEPNGDLIPSLVYEADITLGPWTFEQEKANGDGAESWAVVDDHVTSAALLTILCRWAGWDKKLAARFVAQINNSEHYLTEAYIANRPCPTRDSDYITWEQSIVDANINPLHKCRMPLDPTTQPASGFDFKRFDICFFAVKRDLMTIYGSIFDELAPLFAAAGINQETAPVDDTEVIIPVHAFQVRFVQAREEYKNGVRLLPQTVTALAQASTRSVTVPSLPGLGFKLSLSMIIGDTIRVITPTQAFSAVHYYTAGMFDPSKLSGLQGTPLEIIPEVACANGPGGHLAVTVRWDVYHVSRGPVDADVCYAVAGALCEKAILGQKDCVAASIFGLDSPRKRLAWFREYVRLYFRCYLPLLFRNGLLLDPHGQNSLVRFSRSTGRLIGFSSRDMSSTRFSKTHYERSAGIVIDPGMSHHGMPVTELMERAHWIMMLNHLSPLIYALDLNPRAAASFTATDLENGQSGSKEEADLAELNGCAVMVRELHDVLKEHEALRGDGASLINARELAAAARRVWFEDRTWPMQCFVSQRMRSDWIQRDKNDRLSFRDVPSVILSH